ncbi:CCAAT/enhancer-binding protein zeta-like isoform X2 [Linepithema humile]|uniref:CCAAT/enhancer-binding protein zeta-like isoform X2 n=1 Tax=Linepithema humile TaxID=83485 RepID=UPI00351F02FE
MKRFNDISTISGEKKWYKEYPKTEEPCKHSVSEVGVLQLKDEGKKYLDAETASFQLKQSKSHDSETKWLKTALQQGTFSDRIAANIVLVQDNPKYNFSRLIFLVSQVKGAKHSQCSLVITSLKELFLTDLLHPTFKLLKFEEQDLDKLEVGNESNSIVKTNAARNRLLAHWYFEDQLREQYERFVLSLSVVATDTVDINREKAISVMTDLLMGNAEQEHKLLELIVNKIGDPTSKIGSKAVVCINKLLQEHPNMKLVVLREVEKLLFRKNVSQRAQYYAICVLTQFYLDRNDDEIAVTLVEVYFAFFKACLKKGEPDSRMMAAILTGVNRTYPFAKIDSKVLSKHIDSVYKVVHFGSFNVSLNALTLLHQITGKDESQANRFYSTFYKKLLDPQIGVANKRAMFLNLIYRVLRKDQSVLRLYAFIKRILQITLCFPANMTCAMLYVVSKILQERKDLRHILLKSQKDVNKIENVDCEGKVENVCEVSSSDADVSRIKNKNKATKNTIMLSNVTIGADTASGSQTDVKEETDVKVEEQNVKLYDPFCRNPLYAGVAKGLYTELAALSRHFHPSVAIFANQIIQGKPIEYTGDPLEDLTLIRFLNRYVFKNSKKSEDKKVQKKNDPLAIRAGYTPKGVRSLPVDSAAYLNEREERIPVDELFLHKFWKKESETKDIKKEVDDEDMESVNSEEFNDMLDRVGTNYDLDDLDDLDSLDNLDIATDIALGKKKAKVVDKNNEGNDDELGDEDIPDENDEMLQDFDEDDELQDLSDIDVEDLDDEDLSDMEFNDSDDGEALDDELISNLNEKLKTKSLKTKQNKNKKGIDNNIFVCAEKFAEILEEQSKTKEKHGYSNTFNTSDGASSKQIDWETKRHERLRGSFDRKKRKPGQSSNKRAKRFKR